MSCRNCNLAPPFKGWDECLPCGTAIALVEDPDYIELARRLYADDPVELARLEAEWARQSSALQVAA